MVITFLIYLFIALTLILLLYFITNIIKNKEKDKRSIFGAIYIAILFLLSVVIGYNYSSTPDVPNTTELANEIRNQLNQEFPERVYVPNETKGKDEELTKQSALDTLTIILNDLNDYTDKSAKDRIELVEKSPEKFKEYIPESVLDRLHIPDAYATEEMYTNVSLALLSFSAVFSDVHEDGKIQPVSINLDSIYMDEDNKIVKVPISVYNPASLQISFDLYFMDGQWKISPINLLEGIQLSNQLNDL